jgi:ribosome recycling factor
MSLNTHDINEIEKRMRASIDALKREFSGLRTGRASANLLDPVQVWDRGNVMAVDKGIREANLGLNPIIDGQILRLPIPALTSDRRQELVKLAHKYAEQSKVAIRNVRREAMDVLKKLEKDGKMSQDDHRGHSDKVQELTDRLIKEVDATLVTKEAEIQKV